ncbi:unnamed protein product [Soboliphyme baturini]|uniref:GAE domain-containing protein n=1 Tax=Soboliphyme baturini TaxID=241478 RepID=A0A183ISV7_9BILA|nr:unnamed protein product [Soboliphyme baturini]
MSAARLTRPTYQVSLVSKTGLLGTPSVVLELMVNHEELPMQITFHIHLSGTRMLALQNRINNNATANAASAAVNPIAGTQLWPVPADKRKTASFEEIHNNGNDSKDTRMTEHKIALLSSMPCLTKPCRDMRSVD